MYTLFFSSPQKLFAYRDILIKKENTRLLSPEEIDKIFNKLLIIKNGLFHQCDLKEFVSVLVNLNIHNFGEIEISRVIENLNTLVSNKDFINILKTRSNVFGKIGEFDIGTFSLDADTTKQWSENAAVSILLDESLSFFELLITAYHKGTLPFKSPDAEKILKFPIIGLSVIKRQFEKGVSKETSAEEASAPESSPIPSI